MYETLKHRNLLLALTGKSRFPKLRFSTESDVFKEIAFVGDF